MLTANGATLMTALKTLINLNDTHTGFEGAQNLFSFQVAPAKNGYSVARARDFYTSRVAAARGQVSLPAALLAVSTADRSLIGRAYTSAGEE